MHKAFSRHYFFDADYYAESIQKDISTPLLIIGFGLND